MHGTWTRHGITGMLSLPAIILSLAFGGIVDAHTAYRFPVAANGTTVATPIPTATGTSASVKASTGGSARWGFVLAIFAAIAIFVIGGLFVAIRARGEYLGEQRRKSPMPQEDET
ncbi:MAG: hypothetical protein M3176_09990 [Chloroflexota bacterium]|nr:hypothetical protein [Chloroflexota bacterium]